MESVERASDGRSRLYLRSMNPIRIRLLGGFRVSIGSRELREDDWRRQKSAGLVKLLALAPGQRLHRERVAELLWPGCSPRRSLNNLHRELHAARKVLQPRDPASELYLCLRNRWLNLYPYGAVWVDVSAFEEAVANARRMNTPAAYETALSLYAGELLPQDRYEEWAESRRAELGETRLRLLAELAELYEKLGQPHQAIERLEQAVSGDPTNEAAHETLMRLYTSVGRRQKALEKYEALCENLENFGGGPPDFSRRLYQEILAGKSLEGAGVEPAPPEVTIPPRHNLPRPRTSFVGREHELAEVEINLSMTGLLTLTGGGGGGKTRLALEASRKLVGVYPGGVWLVELASLSDPDLLPDTICGALGLDERPGRPAVKTLLEYLRGEKLLLVLDNCEHLVGAAAHTAGCLLDSCPDLRILATSREPLNVPGELRFAVPPLSLPASQTEPALKDLASSGSVQLLVDRVSARSPGFSLGPGNSGAVADICQKLEGIPLALELAASRIATLGVDEVASLLEGSPGLLSTGRHIAPGRQETLRAALDWSHELLEGLEKKLFHRLAVFTGGWTLEAARMVTAFGEEDGRDVPGALHELVEKSLVVVEPSTPRRYRFLEPVRQYALEHLEESPDLAPARDRHARCFLWLASRSYDEVLSPGRGAWLELLETERGNFRGALAWSFSGGSGEIGLQLIAALRYFWSMRGNLQEARRWLQQGLHAGGTKLSRARAWDTLGTTAIFQSDYDLAYELSEQSMALHREVGDSEGTASSLINLGFCATLGMKNIAALPDYMKEAERLKPLIRDPRMVGFLILFQGLAHGIQGDLARARGLFAESLALHEKIGEVQGAGLAAALLGLVALAAGEDDEAATNFRSALPRAREFGDGILIYYCLWGLACATSTEHPERATKLWGAAESVHKARGVGLPAIAEKMAGYESRRDATAEKLGQRESEAEWISGEAMSESEGIAYALAEPVPQKAGNDKDAREAEKVALPSRPAALTRREREVAELVAVGLTNRRISERLYISSRTADTHVGRILKKLGASSREQVADLLEDV